MNVLCIIPARGGSKRVLNKNVRMLLDKPVIAYTIESALGSVLCNKVAVSTNDSKIASISEEYGADVVIRPAELSLDDSPIDGALRHAVRYYEAKEDFHADIVVLLQANVPIRKEKEIDKVISKLIEVSDATAVATGYVADQRPEWMKTIDAKTGKVMPFMQLTNLYRKQDLPELYLLDGAVISVRKPALMETEGIKKVHGYLGERVYPVIHDAKYSIEIDEEKDFEIAEYYLRKKQLQ
jgi:CMP-N-acetylneuraminic acid synthetase